MTWTGATPCGVFKATQPRGCSGGLPSCAVGLSLPAWPRPDASAFGNPGLQRQSQACGDGCRPASPVPSIPAFSSLHANRRPRATVRESQLCQEPEPGPLQTQDSARDGKEVSKGNANQSPQSGYRQYCVFHPHLNVVCTLLFPLSVAAEVYSS